MKDGGQAFPTSGFYSDDSPSGYDTVPAKGMSLRDWFAGMALAVMTVAPDYSEGPCNSAMAERAYFIADHMIVQRLKDNYQASEEPS